MILGPIFGPGCLENTFLICCQQKSGFPSKNWKKFDVASFSVHCFGNYSLSLSLSLLHTHTHTHTHTHPPTRTHTCTHPHEHFSSFFLISHPFLSSVLAHNNCIWWSSLSTHTWCLSHAHSLMVPLSSSLSLLTLTWGVPIPVSHTILEFSAPLSQASSLSHFVPLSLFLHTHSLSLLLCFAWEDRIQLLFELKKLCPKKLDELKTLKLINFAPS